LKLSLPYSMLDVRLFFRTKLMPPLDRLRQQTRHLKAETHALYLAVRDPRPPGYAKILVAAVAAYALSPIDLILDFIPLPGYLDDLLLLPLGLALAIKLIPPAVLEDCRKGVQESRGIGKPIGRTAGAVVIGIWLLLGAVCAGGLYRMFLG
jgi:uncharacterized membrane protein YkvA (DUF1232 family)